MDGNTSDNFCAAVDDRCDRARYVHVVILVAMRARRTAGKVLPRYPPTNHSTSSPLVPRTRVPGADSFNNDITLPAGRVHNCKTHCEITTFNWQSACSLLIPPSYRVRCHQTRTLALLCSRCPCTTYVKTSLGRPFINDIRVGST